ncbi:uncharacterized protein [Pocillopora verrucosa]|uniref:uncharacterized protein n=1 Tax=Pocillopora verrucosa TaxID=203993 RepID=UPI0033411CF9
MFALLLFGAVFVFAQASPFRMIELEDSLPLAPIPIPVEVQFITQRDEVYTGKKNLSYHAALCGGCSFDGLNARFAVNLVNNPWDKDEGDYITVYVRATDPTGTIIASNEDDILPDFNFTYFAKYKDLFFDVITGPAPSFSFTLSLTFDYKDRVYLPRPCVPRWQMTAEEYAVAKNYSSKDVDSAYDLIPIFKSASTQSVLTRNKKFYRLDYCFGPSHHYNVTITVIANDQQSGFATYVCSKTYVAKKGTCDVLTPNSDISGGAVNVVLMGLDGPMDYGSITVRVRGDGRYGLSNNFTLAGSAPYTIF